ncbi:MAG: hypothetical protein N3F63_01965 [Thermoplasmata archaeon]|nr:hypothetical protein [Thermoplasmata archaeon]
MEKKSGAKHGHMLHIVRVGTRGLIYNGELYAFPDQKTREMAFRQIWKIEEGRSLYAEMDLKARLYKYSRGKFGTS